MPVQIGSNIVEGIYPGNDTATQIAVDVATAIAPSHSSFTHAAVHRKDGLVVMRGELTQPQIPGSLRGWHFRSALCGYTGTGVRGAATILELFGFGLKDEIYEQISLGGDDAFYSFTK